MIRGLKGKYIGEIPKITHKELVDKAFQHLQFTDKHTVVFKERVGSTSENPDVIGFLHGGFTTLIECKSSRADFLVDKKKLFRKRPETGMGHKRYFAAPMGLLDSAEMPDGWGLLEVGEIPPRHQYRTIEQTKESEVFYERNVQAELSYLISSIRRLNISMAVFIEKEAQDEI